MRVAKFQEGLKNEFRQTNFDDVPADIITIIGYKNGVKLPIGSGVIIGDHLALTAWHVIKEFYDSFSSDKVQFEGKIGISGHQFFLKPNFSIIVAVLSYGRTENEIEFFNVECGNASLLSDIAVLQLQPLQDTSYFHFRPRSMRAMPPGEGSVVDALGFICTSGVDGEIEMKAYGSRGQVKSIMPRGRDRSALYFPVFETNARYDGGMSGGPVFDGTGKLCGLVCYSMGAYLDDLDAESVSYAACLFPLLGCLLEVKSLDQSKTTVITIQDACKRGIVETRGHLRAQLGSRVDDSIGEMRMLHLGVYSIADFDLFS